MRKIMIALVRSSLALFATVAGILWFMTDSLHESVHEQMQAEAREYISRIHKQIDKDFQTLHTLASFVEASEIGDLRTLADGLAKANEQNAFISIAYFTTAGEGVISTLNHDTQYDFPLADRYEAVRAAVGKALAGEDVVSYLFESEVTNDRIYIYSLPVYQKAQLMRYAPCSVSSMDTCKSVSSCNCGRAFSMISSTCSRRVGETRVLK